MCESEVWTLYNNSPCSLLSWVWTSCFGTSCHYVIIFLRDYGVLYNRHCSLIHLFVPGLKGIFNILLTGQRDL